MSALVTVNPTTVARRVNAPGTQLRAAQLAVELAAHRREAAGYLARAGVGVG